ncbi:molecular chaperone DnaJ [Sorangium cellulosum]|uniref:Molecular chaperone DnaJ n=1 Tax=Sorangium cellulosum TaxID=56 RepID=A0A2L0ERH7_SORCE|nr:J domain-containing protein [Sorangium cellulosum]AUX41903.1 molecular chaperone DnaJ [Sorangium cellulosum]
MQLPSRLSTSTLGDLLGALHRQKTTGLLELCELRTPSGSTVPGRQHRIQLFSGLVTAIETPLQVPRLGEILARDGSAPAPSIQRLAALVAAHRGRRTGEVLVAAGLIPASSVERALRSQLRARLEALFAIEEATICFHTARPLAWSLQQVGPLSPSDFLYGRPRARDRFRRAAGVGGAWSVGDTRGAGGARGASSGASGAASSASGAASSGGRVDERRRRALDLLGLREGATEAEIRRTFRRLAANLHPDRGAALAGKGAQLGAATARFAELSAAYHLLVA